MPVWWAWRGFTWYSTAFNSDDAVNRIDLLAAMGGVAVLAAGVSGVADGRSDTFVIAYAGLFALLAALYVHAWRRVPAARNLSARYAIGYLSGAALWFASLGLGEGVVLMASPVLAAASLDVISYDPSHIAERYGLFTIIVLGESVVATVAGLDTGSSACAVFIALLGLVSAAAVWWLYFDRRGDARGHDALGLRLGPGAPARLRGHRRGCGGHRVRDRGGGLRTRAGACRPAPAGQRPRGIPACDGDDPGRYEAR